MSGKNPARKTMKVLMKEYKSDRVKNANIIVDVIKRLESNKSSSITLAITGLHQIFTMVLNKEDIKLPRSKLPEDVQSASEKFSCWLNSKYLETHKKLRELLHHRVEGVQELSLCCAVKLMQSEGRHPIRPATSTPGQDDTYYFPQLRLELLISTLVSETVDNHHLITLLSEYLQCQDFMYYTLLAVSSIVSRLKGKTASEVFMVNLFFILEQINIPEESNISLTPSKLFLYPEEDETDPDKSQSPTHPPFVIPYKKAAKAINTVWSQVMSFPLTPDLHRRCLVLLPDKVMPHLKDPLSLTGFFMEAYNMGGALSLMALQGVFILINKHNLDYPDFYTKLYALLEPTIFHARYRPRFFMLLDRFLASSHLPEYVMAAFCKRLSRLSLVAPTPCLALLIKFVANLIIRCPGLNSMMHNPNSISVENDPYDPTEADPSKCRAKESSLWEMSTLQQHSLPYVAKAAGFINRNLPQVEYDIGEYVEADYDEIFERNCKLTVRDTIPTTFHKPSGLFVHHDDHLSMDWCLE